MFQHSNVPAFQQCSVELVITQVDDHVKMRLTSQLINGFSRVLQKLLRYFNGTIISTSFSLPIAGLFSVIFILDLKDSESAKLSFGLSLYYCHKLPDVSDYYINILSIIYLCIIYFTYAVSEWSTIFKCCTLISFICFSGCCIISRSSNCYFSSNKNICITKIT